MSGLRWMAGSLAALLLSLLVAGGALAAKPEVIFRNDSFNGTPFVDTWTCPGLEILNEASITRTWTAYYDREGNETRLVIHARYRLWFTNLANGLTLTTAGTRHMEANNVTGTWTETGVFRAITAKGQGIVLHQSGRSVEDLDTEELLSLSGPHEDWLGLFDDFCSALGG